MPLLEVTGISKSFGGVAVLSGVSLGAEPGEIVCLLGPSGCGKTTLLRLIAGLEAPDAGFIAFEGRVVDGLPPQERGFGLMFQDLALFPTMDVLGNVSFGLRMQKRSERLSREEVARRVDELLDLVDLAGFGRRQVHELSGGERQRVALARSLAAEPRLLMLDEPLGSLDRRLRESLQTQVRAILKEVGVTAVYVTHDRDEAFAMADSMVVMERGAVVQSGTPEDLFIAPRSELVARSMGIRNALTGTVVGMDGGSGFECAVGVLAASDAQAFSINRGDEALALVDERRIVLGPSGEGGPAEPHSLQGVVESRRFFAGEIEIIVRVGKGVLSCLLNPDRGGPAAGDKVSVTVPPDAIRLVPHG